MRLAKAERKVYNHGMQSVLSPMRRAIQDYKMIEDGDRIFVGLSGGKDSVLLLAALSAYRRFSPERFELAAITVDMGFRDTPISEDDPVSELCRSLGVERHIVKTDIAEIVFEARQESNPCSLCAKFRRGALNSEINRLGGGKLALGHNAGQLAVAIFVSGTVSIAVYAPVLLLSGIVTGFFTGQCAQAVLNHMDKLRKSSEMSPEDK